RLQEPFPGYHATGTLGEPQIVLPALARDRHEPHSLAEPDRAGPQAVLPGMQPLEGELAARVRRAALERIAGGGLELDPCPRHWRRTPVRQRASGIEHVAADLDPHLRAFRMIARPVL